MGVSTVYYGDGTRGLQVFSTLPNKGGHHEVKAPVRRKRSLSEKREKEPHEGLDIIESSYELFKLCLHNLISCGNFQKLYRHVF